MEPQLNHQQPLSVEEEKNRNIIGKTPTCAAENCTGWLVDSFSGKYFVKCEDPKHERKKVEEGGEG